MAGFSYKTRGDSDPIGKSKVWVCRNKYIENIYKVISEDILKFQNCVIWYEEKPEDEYDKNELLNTLSQMQLIVIPINSDILCYDNRALATELPYALRCHIPVLPVICEGKLDALFLQKCGELQYLDKTNTDPTAICYEQKLKNYLDTVLFGEEQINKIRSVFDLYIFLSYRKKDRQYAQQLMKLIHSNTFAKGIAIWYDEYLVPGENFNDSILSAMKKSKIFALAVTPNILNENNYVISTEYPEAQKIGMSVLPVEMVKTDKKLLFEKFSGLSDVIDSSDSIQLSDELSKLLKEFIPSSGGSVDRDFLLGLAYLKGVDVEVDFDRSFDLIYGSAVIALPEAVKMLSQMYYNGEGVSVDRKKALIWQEKFVYVCKADFDSSGSDKARLSCIRSYFDLGELYTEMSQYEDAFCAYYDCCRLVNETPKEKVTDQMKEFLALGYEKSGLANKLKGDFLTAINEYQKALNARIADGSCKALAGTASIYYRMGDIAKATGEYTAARDYYEKCHKVCTDLSDSDYAPELSRINCIYYEKAGDLEKSLENYDEALEIYNMYHRLAKRNAEENRTIESLRLLAISYERLGEVKLRTDDIDKAIEMFKESFGIKYDIMKETYSFEALSDLAIAYQELGDVAFELADNETATFYYDKYHSLAEMLYKTTNSIGSRRDLAISLEKKGNVALNDMEYDNADELYRDSLGHFSEINEAEHSFDSALALSVSYDKLGENEFERENYAKAKEYIENALELRQYLYADTLSDANRLRGYISASYSRLGAIALFNGDFNEYMRCQEAEMEYGSELTEISNSSHSVSSRIEFGDEDMEEADKAFIFEDYPKAVELYIAILDNSYLNDTEEDRLYQNLEKLAFYYMRLGALRNDESKAIALRIWNSMSEKCINREYKDNAPCKDYYAQMAEKYNEFLTR